MKEAFYDKENTKCAGAGADLLPVTDDEPMDAYRPGVPGNLGYDARFLVLVYSDINDRGGVD